MDALNTAQFPVAVSAPFRPEWLRISDAIKFCGIGRSSLYELIADGKIKSCCLRQRGSTRGIRLLSADSISNYLESLVDVQK